jgi:hypothetical protein
MKEREESRTSEEYSIKNKVINNENLEKFREVLQNIDNYSVHLAHGNQNYVNINNYSFMKINQMIQSYPEENIVFLFNKQKFYTPRDSLRLSNSSINKNSNFNSSFSSSFKNENLKNFKEEIINTDIIKPEINKTGNNNKINEILNFDEYDSDKQEDDNYINNIKNIQRSNNNISTDKTHKNNINNNNKKKFIVYKWIFHFYLLIGIITFLHYISFIFSKYNEYMYKYVCIVFIICLLYIGYIGIKNRITKENHILLDGDNLFWTNFFVFILTMINFISLVLVGGHFKFIKEQGILGYLIVLIFIIALIVEAIYVLYHDVVIEQILLEKFNNDNIEESNKNDLNIQLMDVN